MCTQLKANVQGQINLTFSEDGQSHVFKKKRGKIGRALYYGSSLCSPTDWLFLTFATVGKSYFFTEFTLHL